MSFKIENGVLLEYIDEENVTDIIIPEGIKRIDDEAFRRSDITSVIIPEGVEEIGDSAFSECVNLKKISIPASVTIFEDSVFFLCLSLENIEVAPENKILCVVNGILYDKEMTELIRCPSEYGKEVVEVPYGIKYIDGYAFHCCKVKKIILPDSVEEIFSSAFCFSSIEEMTIPDSVKKMHAYAFEDCENLKKVVFSRNQKSIPMGVFGTVNSDGACIEEIVIPNGIEVFEEDAFGHCTLKNINIPASVKKLDGAFGEGCDITGCITVDPNNTEYSDIDGLLYDKEKTILLKCPMRTTITLPPTCVEIDEDAITDTNLSLEKIYVDENSSEFSSIDGILYNKSGTELILCPYAHDEHIVIPDGVEKIAEGAFTNHLWHIRHGLVITIPNSVKEIGNAAIGSECDVILKYHGKEKRVTLEPIWHNTEGEPSMLDQLRSDM